MQKSFHTSAFTLIEFIVVIAVFLIVTLVSYAPYDYYQKKIQVKNTAKQLSQIISKSRNYALNGITHNSGNRDVGIWFQAGETKNNHVEVVSYPLESSLVDIQNEIGMESIENHSLERGIQIDNIDDKESMLFLFDSIDGDVQYYIGNKSNIVKYLNKDGKTPSEIDISFSYKGSTSSALKKTIHYITNTHIVNH